MWTAVGNAAGLVRPGGMLAIALYRKTPLCGLWTIEKRIYKSASPAVQASFRAVYRAAYFAGLLATGRSPRQYLRSYQTERGMDWSHDVHDWMGGYPYESVTPEQVKHRLQALGLSMVRSFEKPAAALGLFGSHCDEFVAVRPA
jgi:2-polyprenyl-6-hydroxyphenyl methylase/3-demethylubiquinone-9 3-methyltransferase